MTQPPQRWLASILLAAAASFAALSPADLPAETITWDGGGADNLWTTPENWSGDVVPGREDDVVFDGTSTKDCLVEKYRVDILALTVDLGYEGTLTFGLGASSELSGDFTQRDGLVDWGSLGSTQHTFYGNYRDTGEFGSAGGDNASFEFPANGSNRRRSIDVGLGEFRIRRLVISTLALRDVHLRARGDFSFETVALTNALPIPVLVGRDAVLSLDGTLTIRSGGGLAVSGPLGGGRMALILEDAAEIEFEDLETSMSNGGSIHQLGSSAIRARSTDIAFTDEVGDPIFGLEASGTWRIFLRDPDQNVEGGRLDRARVELRQGADPASGDSVFIDLVETGSSTGDFRGTFSRIDVGLPVDRTDQRLQLQYGSNDILLRYVDAEDASDEQTLNYVVMAPPPSPVSGALTR